MPFLTVHCCTWNVGDEKPPADDLTTFLGIDGRDLPDVVSVSLQEVVSEDAWRNRLIEHLYPRGYVLIKSRNCWAIWVYAFVKRHLLVAITNIESEVTPSGYCGVMGNKGGASVRFELCGINMIFLSCHFTAHSENNRERLNDYFDIINHQSFRDEDVNVILDHDYVFWMGDLNFRLEDISKSEVEEKIREERFTELIPHDQLLKMKEQKLIFQDFSEGKISFPPTFKFDKGTDTYDSSPKQRVPAWTDRILYMAHRDFALDHHLNLSSQAKKRSPSPSRKVPYRGSPSQVEKKYPSNSSSKNRQHPEADLIRYTSLPQYKSSDHRPVVADFKLSVPPRWFSLPVKFGTPNPNGYSSNVDLKIHYKVISPPELLKLSESNSILTSHVMPSVSDLTQMVLMNRIDDKNQSNVQGDSYNSINAPLPPPSYETASFDWIGLYLSDFSDLEKDYITYVYASNSITTSRQRKKSIKSAFLKPFHLNLFQETTYTTKIESRYLKNLVGKSVCLIYMSRNKHCPQGYSAPFKIKQS